MTTPPSGFKRRPSVACNDEDATDLQNMSAYDAFMQKLGGARHLADDPFEHDTKEIRKQLAEEVKRHGTIYLKFLGVTRLEQIARYDEFHGLEKFFDVDFADCEEKRIETKKAAIIEQQSLDPNIFDEWKFVYKPRNEKTGDWYFTPPRGKRLRSVNEIMEYLRAS